MGGRGGGVGNFAIPWARSRSGGRLKPAKGGWQGKGGHVVVPSDTRESMGLPSQRLMRPLAMPMLTREMLPFLKLTIAST